MDAPTLEALTTVAGAALLTSVLVWLLFQTIAAADALKARFGPVIAVVVGVIVVELATFTIIEGPLKQDIGQGLINGIFAGLAAMGIHDFGKKTISGDVT